MQHISEVINELYPEEVWKECHLGEGKYSVSNQGNIKRNLTGELMYKRVQNSGYYLVGIHHQGKAKKATIHRLVAIAFLDHVPGKTFVDHIDSNKLNNNLSNLRWVTAKENAEFASKNGRLINVGKKAKIRMVNIGYEYGFCNSQKYLIQAQPVFIYVDGEYKEFRSIRQAAAYLNIEHKGFALRIRSGMKHFYKGGIKNNPLAK